MRSIVVALLLAGCSGPETKANLALLRSTPELGTPMANAPDISFVFDYEILEPGLRYGGVKADSISFHAYGKISWADGSTGSSARFFREPTELRLGSELRGTNLAYTYPGGDLAAVINHAQTPKLDANGKPIVVERVELMGALRWSYGCTNSEPGGTSSCPANLGHFESLGPIVF